MIFFNWKALTTPFCPLLSRLHLFCKTLWIRKDCFKSLCFPLTKRFRPTTGQVWLDAFDAWDHERKRLCEAQWWKESSELVACFVHLGLVVVVVSYFLTFQLRKSNILCLSPFRFHGLQVQGHMSRFWLKHRCQTSCALPRDHRFHSNALYGLQLTEAVDPTEAANLTNNDIIT